MSISHEPILILIMNLIFLSMCKRWIKNFERVHAKNKICMKKNCANFLQENTFLKRSIQVFIVLLSFLRDFGLIAQKLLIH